MEQSKGYIITEKNHVGVSTVLFASREACGMTGLPFDELMSADPSAAVRELDVEKEKLDGGHELWVLEKPQSRQKKASELEEMNLALENALKEAEAANKAKSSFLSNMSHDIRTPMNAIMGMTSIGLSHIDEKARVQDCLLKIKTASTHLMSLVNDVLDMSRIDSGRLTLNEEEFSIADLIHDIAVIMRPQAEQKHQTFNLEIGQVCEENLVGDPLRLRQILVNIIGNAVKYTLEDGRINVKFSQYRKEAVGEDSPERDRVWLDFVCEDNGLGMSPEFLKRIFLPFERVNNSTNSKIEGTGLGMSIVKSLVDKMGGEIQVESTECVGSKFHVEVPISVTLKPKTAPIFPAERNVLVVESNESRTEQISEYLRDGGLNPIVTGGGLKAVTLLTEEMYEEHPPCAMLLGQEPGDMSALELAAHVRQLAGPDFPIILVSDQDWALIEYRAARAGINAFVPCPLFKSRLLTAISELTGKLGKKDDFVKASLDYSKYRLLLVEDVEINREIVIEMLSSTGINIESAENGARAVKMFETSSEGYYDIIFMDIQMPIMDGYEASKRIRALPRSDAKSVWIVAMTANAFVEDIRKSREAGMNEHCSKPVDPERLHEIMRSRLRQHDAQE
ncbi:MAG: response regulator [Bacteroides sp.]|nr:response regulator [Bacteroides sp.]